MVLLVGSPSPPHPVWGGADCRRPAAVGRRGFVWGALPAWIGRPDSPDPDRTGGEGWPRVRGAGGCGHGDTGPGVRPTDSVRVEGFLPVWGGFSSLTGLKPSPDQTQTPPNPTDQVMDDCVSPGRPAEREHVLSKSPLYRDHTHPAVPPPPPTHQSEEPDNPSRCWFSPRIRPENPPHQGCPSLLSFPWVADPSHLGSRTAGPARLATYGGRDGRRTTGGRDRRRTTGGRDRRRTGCRDRRRTGCRDRWRTKGRGDRWRSAGPGTSDRSRGLGQVGGTWGDRS